MVFKPSICLFRFFRCIVMDMSFVATGFVIEKDLKGLLCIVRFGRCVEHP
jgi:hypothetical protein